MNNMSLIMFLSIFVIFSLSIASAQDGEFDIQENLRIYVETMTPELWQWPDRVIMMEKKGININKFSYAILNDLEYSEYWNDALFLNAGNYYLHKKNEYNQLFFEMCDFLQREERVTSYPVLNAKVSALNIIKSLLGPKSFDDSKYKSKVLDTLSIIFKDGNPVVPTYWINKFNLSSLADSPKEDLDESQINLLHIPVTASRMCMKLFWRLSILTGDPKYFESCESVYNSDNPHPQLLGTLEFLKSDTCKSSWNSGRYDLFTFYESRYSNKNQSEQIPITPVDPMSIREVMKNKK